MMDKCFDEGTLQAFLDNELEQHEAQKVARHLADCDVCAMLLAEVEEETALVFGALGEELDTLVPTERLWTKINDSIEVQNRSRGWWSRLGALFASFGLTPLRATAFASVALVATLAFVRLGGFGTTEKIVADKTTTPVSVSAPNDISTPDQRSAPPSIGPTLVSTKPSNSAAPRVVKAKNFAAKKPEVEGPSPRPVVETAKFVDGEETYVDTIARLEKTVDLNKDDVLKPSARVAYEKDLAVVNGTISKMRDEVKKNPRSDDAKELLFASYRNKIEILSSVSQRGDLISAVR